MIKQIFFSALSLSVLTSNSQVVPNLDWKENYSEKNQIANFPSAIDANNNAFVTGYTYPNSPSNQDATTLKYAPTGGAPLWVAHYDNGGVDNAKAIILDASSNVYITGESDGVGTGRDIFCVKYDQNGNVIFTYRYNGASNGNDIANAITTDGTGNTFITGYTTNMGGSRDYICIKLNSLGQQQFAVIFNGTGNLNDESVAIGFNSNRLYITGNSTNTSGNTDIVTLRLNPANGATVWTQSINGTLNSNDLVNAILPYNNDVVIVGQVKNTVTSDDYITTRYNGNNGAIQWQKNYDFVNTSGGATALTSDASGNFAVTGLVNNAGIYEYHTLLYNNSGVQQWVNKVSTGLNYTSANPQIAVDQIANHFYVCGQKLGVQSDIFVYQITPTGNKTWDELINGAQNGPDAAVDLVVNSMGQIYVAGASLNSNAKFDYTTLKISQTPVYFPIDFNNINEVNSKSHYFYPNVGEVRDLNNQVANEVLFSTKHTFPQQFVLSNNNLAFLLAKLDTSHVYPTNDSLHRVNLEFNKSNKGTKSYPFEFNNDNQKNYFLSYVSQNPITDNKGASRILIPNIYPNIDLHYYSNDKGLKMYFVVKPGGNPNDIEMNFNGASSSSINGSSELVIGTLVGSFKFAKPQIYNVNLAMQTPTATGIVGWSNVSGNTYKINTGTYNNTLPLVIQINQGPATTNPPIQNMSWSSYFGGSGNDIINSVKSNNSGDIFICGSTNSPNLPPGAGFQPPLQSNLLYGNTDGFLSRFSQGNAVLFASTYIGGVGIDKCLDVDMDFPTNNVFVVGITTSSVFPILSKPGAYNNSTFIGPINVNNTTGNDYDDSFIFQTDAFGSTNKWCTYYNGNGFDRLSDCRLDAAGNLFVVGASASTNIPLVTTSGGQYLQGYNTAQQAQSPPTGIVYDAIIAKFQTGTSALSWATYFGTDINTGTTNVSDDYFYDLDFDSNNNVYVAASVGGINMPGKLNNHFNTSNSTDGAIVKFTNNGNLVFSKHTQGNTNTFSVKINNNKVYMCGRNDVNIVTQNSGQYYYNGVNNIGAPVGSYEGNLIVYDLNFNLIHASYLGGNGNDIATDLQFDNNGVFYICGGTNSSNFPIVAPANIYSSNNAGQYDYFISAFKEGTPNLLWSTQLGSSTIDSDFGTNATMAFDQFAGLHIAGQSNSSTGYPPVSAGGYFQGTSAGGFNDGTITRFNVANLVGIREFNKNSNLFSVYPNPTENLLNIKDEKLVDKNVTYAVYNTLGQKVLQGKLNLELGEAVNVSTLNSGTYIINFVINSNNYNTKFVKVN